MDTFKVTSEGRNGEKNSISSTYFPPFLARAPHWSNLAGGEKAQKPWRCNTYQSRQSIWKGVEMHLQGQMGEIWYSKWVFLSYILDLLIVLLSRISSGWRDQSTLIPEQTGPLRRLEWLPPQYLRPFQCLGPAGTSRATQEVCSESRSRPVWTWSLFLSIRALFDVLFHTQTGIRSSE